MTDKWIFVTFKYFITILYRYLYDWHSKENTQREVISHMIVGWEIEMKTCCRVSGFGHLNIWRVRLLTLAHFRHLLSEKNKFFCDTLHGFQVNWIVKTIIIVNARTHARKNSRRQLHTQTHWHIHTHARAISVRLGASLVSRWRPETTRGDVRRRRCEQRSRSSCHRVRERYAVGRCWSSSCLAYNFFAAAAKYYVSMVKRSAVIWPPFPLWYLRSPCLKR